MQYLTIEHHPNDSRIKIKKDEICQGLTSRMGTGGGNIPLVLAIESNEEQCQTETTKHGCRRKSPTR